MLDCLCQLKASTGRHHAAAGRCRSLVSATALVTFVSVAAHIPLLTLAAREEALTNSSHDEKAIEVSSFTEGSGDSTRSTVEPAHTATPPPWEDIAERLGSGLPKLFVMVFFVLTVACCGAAAVLARRALICSGARVPALGITEQTLNESRATATRRHARTARTRNDREMFLREVSSQNREDHSDEYTAFNPIARQLEHLECGVDPLTG